MLARLVWIAALCATGGCSRFDVELLDATAEDVPRVLPSCQGHVCACVDGIDNDEDGRADGLDEACTGALDDDEAALGVGPARAPSCLDCFFDDNEGSDEGCSYAASCRADGTPATTGSCRACDAQPECVTGCRALVPNGCDCFGCCVVESGAATHTVVLAEGCSAATLTDPSLCPPCAQAAWCLNTCERCERCPGRTELPADCVPSCGDGEVPCSSGAECAPGQACILGCCIASP